MSRCPRCHGKIIREDDIVARQPEHTCIACGWNDLRPVMSAEEAARDAARSEQGPSRGYFLKPTARHQHDRDD